MDRTKRLIDLITKLSENGTLDKLYTAGLLSSKTTVYRDMFLKFEAYQKQGFGKKQSREMVASFFKCADERTVFRACALMKTEV